MELSFAQQTVAFLYSLVLGAALAAVYGLMKFCRFAFSLGKIAVVVLDFLFMQLWAMSVFFFSLAYLRGYVRFYVFLGSFAGFLPVRLTIGRVMFAVYSPLLCLIKAILHKFCRKLKIFANYLLKIVHQILYNISSKKERFIRQRKITTTNSEKRKKHEVKKTKYQAGKYKSRR